MCSVVHRSLGSEDLQRSLPLSPVTSCPIAYSTDAKRSALWHLPPPSPGLLPVVLPSDQHQLLMGMDGQEITVDLETCSILVGGDDDLRFEFEIDGFARHCLLQGMDRLDFLLAEDQAIKTHEARL